MMCGAVETRGATAGANAGAGAQQAGAADRTCACDGELNGSCCGALTWPLAGARSPQTTMATRATRKRNAPVRFSRDGDDNRLAIIDPLTALILCEP